MAKLDAFLEVYCRGLDPWPAQALGAFWRLWNDPAGPSGMQAAWEALDAHQAALRRHSMTWTGRLGLAGELAGNLAQFCEERLK